MADIDPNHAIVKSMSAVYWRGGDTTVTVAVVVPGSEHRETRRAFLGGSHGRTRAALTAAGVLYAVLRDAPA